mmetsp:Transcript_69831/g.215960  ORF Transcript_69831/g.215960 Transcript_69831/m.215960 type:complete len:135 (+) Transcript_69831:80-484(+)
MQLVVFRRLALALLLLAGGAEGGVLKNLFQGIYDRFAGPECNKQCMAATYAKAEVFMAKCDENSDGHISKTEWNTLMDMLFRMKEEDKAAEEYEKIGKMLEANQMGIPTHKLKFIFQHKSWRDMLNKRVADGSL